MQSLGDYVDAYGRLELESQHVLALGSDRLQKSGKALFGDESISAPGIPLVLFYGPAHKGNTHALRIIAASSRLKLFVLDTKKLQKDSYRAPHLWATTLTRPP